MTHSVDDFELIEDAEVPMVAPATRPPADLERIKKWLMPTDYASLSGEYHRHLASLVPGTGQWVQGTPQYQEWQNSQEEGIIWIKGVAGAGKSVMAASIVQKLEDQSSSILYFFFRQIMETNRTARSLLGDFLCQLLPSSSVLQKILWPIVEGKKELAEVSTSELWQYLTTALGTAEKVFCIIDALDEMDYDEEFVSRLNSLGALRPDRVKIVATSRPKQYLQRALKNPIVVHVSPGEALVKRDVDRFVENQTSSFIFDEETRTHVVSTICERSNGLFLCARLMLDETAAETDAAAMRATASKLPTELEEMYNCVLYERSIWTGIDEKIQLVILQLLTQSARPLRLLEIAKAVEQYGLHPTGMTSKEVVRRACGPLLNIMEDEVVQIIHHSLTEFLVNKNREQQHGHQFPVIDPVHAHHDIALLCLSYLQLDGVLDSYKTGPENDFHGRREFERFDFKPILMKYPFTLYAAQNWPHHARCCGSKDAELVDAITKFSHTSKPHFAAWCELRASTGDNEMSARNATALHAAAGLGLFPWVEYLISEGAELDALDWSQNTPLYYAASSGFETIVDLLIRKGANPDTESYKGRKPMHVAASRGHSGVVRVLLKASVPPTTPQTKEVGRRCGNAPSSLGHHGVMFASKAGHVETVMEMVPYLKTEEIEQSLCWAAENGRHELVKALLDESMVSPDAMATGACGTKGSRAYSGPGITALHFAASAQQPRCVELLLQRGAKVDKMSEVGYSGLVIGTRTCSASTALHGLAKSHVNETQKQTWEKVLRLLLDAGADLEAKDGKGRTPLLLASARFGYRQPSAGFQTLLQAGADPCAVDNEGSGLIHSAANMEYLPEVIPLLIKRGVSPDQTESKEGRTAMHLVVADAYSASLKLSNMKILAKHGASVNISDFTGNTPLHLACKSFCYHRLEVITWLLANGARANAQNMAGQTCLFELNLYPSETNDRNIVELLLKSGLDLDLLDSNGRTALHAAVFEVDKKLDLILENMPPAHISTRTRAGKTVLHLACQIPSRGHFNRLDRVKRLIQCGADVQWTDPEGNTLLHEVAANFEGREEDVQLVETLIELGVPISARNDREQSALHMFSSKPRPGNRPFQQSLISIFQAHDSQFPRDPVDSEGLTPLHLAVGSEITAFRLISAGADVNARSRNLETPLHHAARLGSSGVVSMLLQFGATITSNIDGHTPLYEACVVVDPACIRLLIDAGAEAYPELVEVCMNSRNDSDEEKTALKNEAAAMLLAARAKDSQFEDKCVLNRVRAKVLNDIMENYHKRHWSAYEKLRDCIPSMTCAELDDLVSRGVDFTRPFPRYTPENYSANPISYIAELGLTKLVLRLIGQVRNLDDSEFISGLSADEVDLLRVGPIIQQVCAGTIRNMDMLKLLVTNGMNVNARRFARKRANGYTRELELGPTALHILAIGDSWWQAEAADYLINEGAHIDAVDQNGRTPLHYASMSDAPSGDIMSSARHFSYQICETLLRSGANPNHVDLDGNTPLNVAGDESTIGLLLRYGADMNLGSKSTIILAMESGRPELLKFCLENGGDCDAPDRSSTSINEIDRYPITTILQGRHPPMETVQDLLRLLLKHGVKLDIVVGDAMIIHYLFERAPPSFLAPFFEGRFFDPNLRDPRGRTVFLAAFGSRYQGIPEQKSACELLSDSEYYQDIDYTAADNSGRHLGFHICNHWKDELATRFAKELRDLIPQKDNRGYSCLGHALKLRRFKTALQFIESGGDLWEEDPDGDFALHHLCRSENAVVPFHAYEQIITKFISQVSINVRNRIGETPLHIYLTARCAYNYLHGLPLLISKGADVFARDNRGETMLHRVAKRTSLPMLPPRAIIENDQCDLTLFQQFVAYGCDPLQEENDGMTALDFAAATGKQNILEAYQSKSSRTAGAE